MSYAYPGSMHTSPEGGLSISHRARGCQGSGCLISLPAPNRTRGVLFVGLDLFFPEK